MNEDSSLYVRIEIDAIPRPLPLSYDPEPEDYLQWVSAEILASDGDGHDYRVGVMHAVLVELDKANNAGVSAFDVVDSDGLVSSHLAGLLPHMEAGTGPFEEGSGDALIVDSIAIQPAARGYGIGPVALATTIDHFYRYGIATVIRPWPLQFLKTTTTMSTGRVEQSIAPRGVHYSVDLSGLNSDLRASFQRLTRLWERLGFREVPIDGDDNVWVLPPHQLPTFDVEAADSAWAS